MAGKNANNGLEKISLGKVGKWLVREAKKVGLDIVGFEHEITNEFVRHVIKNHGNEKIESARGQIAIKESDFRKIPEIVRKPDYAIVGAKRNGKCIVIYTKKTNGDTILYFEDILSGRNNRTLRGKTMYKRKNDTDKEAVLNVITSRYKTDVSGAKIVVGAGGQASNEAV